jgi:hypothetical protein
MDWEGSGLHVVRYDVVRVLVSCVCIRGWRMEDGKRTWNMERLRLRVHRDVEMMVLCTAALANRSSCIAHIYEYIQYHTLYTVHKYR